MKRGLTIGLVAAIALIGATAQAEEVEVWVSDPLSIPDPTDCPPGARFQGDFDVRAASGAYLGPGRICVMDLAGTAVGASWVQVVQSELMLSVRGGAITVAMTTTEIFAEAAVAPTGVEHGSQHFDGVVMGGTRTYADASGTATGGGTISFGPRGATLRSHIHLSLDPFPVVLELTPQLGHEDLHAR
jgi:hypothetical protein